MYWKYFKYVIRHKWFVMLECFKVGLYWRGIVHDISKLLPSEFIPYANHFYGEGGEKGIKKGRNKSGYYKPYNTGNDSFDFAWLLHQKRNRHHWQYWILPKDDGGTVIFDMPKKYLREMLCDWHGAGRAINGKNDTVRFYLKNKANIQLSVWSRNWIEAELQEISSEDEWAMSAGN